MLLTFVVVQFVSDSRDIPLAKGFAQFPQRIGRWEGKQDVPFSPETLSILNVTDYLHRNYFSAGRQSVNLYIGYFSSQKHGKQIHSPKHCLPGSGWEEGRYQVQWIQGDEGKGEGFWVNRYLVSKGMEKNLVFYWYRSRGRVVTNEYIEKLYLVWDGITRRRTDGALIRVIVPIKSASGEEESKEGAEFIREVAQAINRFLPS